MKIIYRASLMLVALLWITGCEDVSDLAVSRVVAPVVMSLEDSGASEVTATFNELDKSGILDKDVGIVSMPVAGLSVEVFAGSTNLGMFITDIDGQIVVSYTTTKPNEFAGSYKGVAFRIKK